MLDLMLAIVFLEQGMSCKYVSTICTDYVPALCTHRPSLLPIGVLVKMLDFKLVEFIRRVCKSSRLEEGKVVTRLP